MAIMTVIAYSGNEVIFEIADDNLVNCIFTEENLLAAQIMLLADNCSRVMIKRHDIETYDSYNFLS